VCINLKRMDNANFEYKAKIHQMQNNTSDLFAYLSVRSGENPTNVPTKKQKPLSTDARRSFSFQLMVPPPGEW